MRLDRSSTGADTIADAVHRALLPSPLGTIVVDDRVPSRAVVDRLVRAHDPLLPGDEVDAVSGRVLARLTGLGPLEPLFADDSVTDVMVNGPGPVWIERDGSLIETEIVLDRQTIEHLIERVVSPLGLRIDRASPLIDARLPDGSRVHAVVPPLAVDGPCLTVRRFGARPVALEAYCGPHVAALLWWAVDARANIVVAGGTGAGKTTLLNTLAGAIGSAERVITIEDAAELRLPGRHVVRLEARPASQDGVGEVTIRDLVRNALRMRPDRLVVGEVRGPEALDMLQAMNTGHEGSLSTCHANSPSDALRRLETMVLMGEVALPLAAVREQLVAALDLIVHVARRPGGRRRVVGVAEVVVREGDDVPTRAHRVRVVAGEDAVVALPSRPPRRAGASPPDPAWLTPLGRHPGRAP